jgi:ABC-type bacteriocin/lantibiotic exporter with double-glycine peptidase domain
MHALGLVTPLVFGAVLDKVVVHQARSPLLALAVAALLAILFDAAIGLAHDRLLLHANPKTDMRLAARIFRHALSLTLPFFTLQQAGSPARDMQQDQSVRGLLTNNLFFALTELTALVLAFSLASARRCWWRRCTASPP